jgi:fatty acid desaturase
MLDANPSLEAASGPAVAARGAVTPSATPAPEPAWFRPALARAQLKALTRRSDAESLVNFGTWLVLLVAAGALAAATWGTWWAVPAFFVYGTLYCSSDARWHELAHGTPFKTAWLNDGLYQLCAFLTIREANLWRWSHTRHHTHTILGGKDPEIQVMRPPRLGVVALDFFYLVGGPIEVAKVLRHAAGIVPPDVAGFVPESERAKMIWTSRAYVAIVGGVIAWSIAAGSLLPLMFVWTPRFYCGWFHQLLGLTQHAGLAMDVHDHRLNSRTFHTNAVFRFLYMNMNYHTEHHMLPVVPWHALPALHEQIRPQCPPAYPSVWSVYREMVPALLRQRRDPGHFIRRELPPDAR